jgi:glycosyltransferase involved in cell wall biosynthesis
MSNTLESPMLSVVIPVKNNSGTLQYTLNTVLNQKYANLQIVVSNNSMQEDIYHLVQSINDNRVKYICPDHKMNFSEDWEFALSGADGDYVTFLGDDDGVLLDAYSYGMQNIINYSIEAFVWKKLNYNWPNHLISSNRNLLEGESEPVLQRVITKRALKLLAKFKYRYNELPCIYNSIVSKQAIDKIRMQSPGEKFFSGVIPDVYSSIVLSTVIKEHIFASFPLTLNGASDKSSGVMQGISNISKEQKDQISDVLTSGNHYHRDIGDFSSSIASIVMGEFLLAKSILNNLPDPSWRAYVKYLAYEAKTAVQSEKIRASAQYTKKKRKLLFLRLNIKKNTNDNFRNNKFEGAMVLPEQVVDNVETAAELFYSLVPNDSKVIFRTNTTILKSWLSKSYAMLVMLYRNFHVS